MSRERRREQVRDVRRRLAHDGPPWTRDHANDFDTVTVPERDCDALRDLLIAEDVETIVEVGLAYGSSAKRWFPPMEGDRSTSSSIRCRPGNGRTLDGR